MSGVYLLALLASSFTLKGEELNLFNIKTHHWLTALGIVLLFLAYISEFIKSTGGNDKLTAHDGSAALLEIIKLMGLVCIFISSNRISKLRKATTRFIQFLYTAGGILGVFSIYSFYSDAGFMGDDLNWLLFRGRLVSTFPSPNVAAAFFGVLSLLVLNELCQNIFKSSGRNKFSEGGFFSAKNATAILCLIICATCVVLTKSRFPIALLAVLVPPLIMFNIWGRINIRRTLFVLFMTIVASFLLISIVGGGEFQSRVNLSLEDSSTRLEIYSQHLNLIERNILVGYGIGRFPELNRAILNSNNYSALWIIRSMHNTYLQWLEAIGITFIPLMALFLFHLCGIFVKLLKGRLNLNYLGIVFSLIFIAIHGAVDIDLEIYSIAILFSALLGFSCALS